MSLPSECNGVKAGCRIHWHGWITFIDPYEFLLTRFTRLKTIIQFEIDTIGNGNWKKYVNKDRSFFTELCETNKVAYTITQDSCFNSVDLLAKHREFTKKGTKRKTKEPVYVVNTIEDFCKPLSEARRNPK